MSRRNRRSYNSYSKNTYYSQTRDISTITNMPMLRSVKKFDYTPIMDRRIYHPEGIYSPVYTKFAQPTKIKEVRTRVYTRPTVSFRHDFGFANVSQVITCVRRKIRKQVLHAFKKTGKSGQRTPRYNYLSKVRC